MTWWWWFEEPLVVWFGQFFSCGRLEGGDASWISSLDLLQINLWLLSCSGSMFSLVRVARWGPENLALISRSAHASVVAFSVCRAHAKCALVCELRSHAQALDVECEEFIRRCVYFFLIYCRVQENLVFQTNFNQSLKKRIASDIDQRALILGAASFHCSRVFLSVAFSFRCKVSAQICPSESFYLWTIQNNIW